MKMESLRRVYGIAEPIRRGMELKIVQEGQWKPAALGGRNESTIHEDILTLGGRETEVTWEDVFDGMSLLFNSFPPPKQKVSKTFSFSTLGDDLREPATFHDEMEHRLKMNW